jgi:hypothetical protein
MLIVEKASMIRLAELEVSAIVELPGASSLPGSLEGFLIFFQRNDI